MKKRLTFCGLLALASVIITCPSASSQQSKPGATLEVKINYTGSGTVDEKHKIYVVLWDSPDFVGGGGSMPMEVQPVTSKNGTAVFSGVSKSPVYLSAAYDPSGQWDAQSGPPPSGSSLGLYGKEKPEPAKVDSGKKASVELAFADSMKMP